jgi:8-oxo-dGTP pyrophosphatase MutT (NUDIX family)
MVNCRVRQGGFVDKNKVICHIVNDAKGTVERSRTALSGRPSVYAIIRDGNQILTIRNLKTGQRSLPGGGADGQTYFDALVREVWEETGLKVKTAKYWGSLTNFLHHLDEDGNAHYWHLYLEIFVCTVEDLEMAVTSANNPDREGEPEWVDIHRLRKQDMANIFWDIIYRLRTPFWIEVVKALFWGLFLPTAVVSIFAAIMTLIILRSLIVFQLVVPS